MKLLVMQYSALPCISFILLTNVLLRSLCAMIDYIINSQNIRQHYKYLFEHIGYMFRPVNRSSSGLQQNKSKVLLRNWDPNTLYGSMQV